jgi:hypothetical protein
MVRSTSGSLSRRAQDQIKLDQDRVGYTIEDAAQRRARRPAAVPPIQVNQQPTKLSPATIRVAAKRTVPLCGGRSTRIRAHSSCRTAGSIAKRWPVSTRVVREALSGSAPCHLGIRRAVLVDVAAAGLGFHVDIRVHRVFARYARTDFQHRRVHRAAVL